MKNIPFEKLTKSELITLINRCDHSGRIRDQAAQIYFESRNNKNDAESEAISKAIEDNLNAQNELIPEFNACKDIDKKVKIGAKLGKLADDYKKLVKQWQKTTEKGNALFSECY